jgi:UDP-glucose 4-epimerase
MKYLVTGGAGFIGSHVVNLLIAEGSEVIVVDDLSNGKKSNVNSQASLVVLDISEDSNKSWLKDLMNGVDTVFHLAALPRVQPSIENPEQFNKVNVDGTLNVLVAARDANVRRVVYSASSSAYGDASVFPTPEDHPTDPLSPYGLQKLIGEQYCRVFYHCYGLETVSLRYFNVFGEGMSLDGAYCLVMGIFAQQRLNGQPMTIVGDGEQRRDFTYVGDLAKANLLAAKSDKVGKGEIINIGNGDNRSVNHIAKLIGGPTINTEPRIEPKQTLADNSKAKNLLGWSSSTTVEEWIPKYKKQIGL